MDRNQTLVFVGGYWTGFITYRCFCYFVHPLSASILQLTSVVYPGKHFPHEPEWAREAKDIKLNSGYLKSLTAAKSNTLKQVCFPLICLVVTYLQPRWTSGKHRKRWWELANPLGTVSAHPWWYWCLHRHSLRCLSSRHLWGCAMEYGRQEEEKESFHTVKIADISTFTSPCELRNEEIVLLWVEKKNLISFCILQRSCYHPPGLFYSDFPSVMHAFQRGHGLLVLADWTSQCCELEWHSVMDDLPHADLAKSLAHCCRLFLIVKIHTALGQDRLILTKSTTESPHSGRVFLNSYV